VLKQILHKIASVLMAFIVLFSSFYFTVHEHVCGGEIADVSYFIEADSCGMGMNECTTDSSQQSIEKEPCCKDISKVIEGNSNDQQALQSLNIQQVQFLSLFINSHIQLFENLDTKSTFFQEYSPPIVVKDIPVLYDTFII